MSHFATCVHNSAGSLEFGATRPRHADQKPQKPERSPLGVCHGKPRPVIQKSDPNSEPSFINRREHFEARKDDAGILGYSEEDDRRIDGRNRLMSGF